MCVDDLFEKVVSQVFVPFSPGHGLCLAVLIVTGSKDSSWPGVDAEVHVH